MRGARLAKRVSKVAVKRAAWLGLKRLGVPLVFLPAAWLTEKVVRHQVRKRRKAREGAG